MFNDIFPKRSFNSHASYGLNSYELASRIINPYQMALISLFVASITNVVVCSRRPPIVD